MVVTSWVLGSVKIPGSTKNRTPMATSSPAARCCSVKQKQSILEKYSPALNGVTLKVAVPVRGASDKLVAR